jgi:hypothetical protein
MEASGLFCIVINFEQTAQRHPEYYEVGKQTSRTERFCAPRLNGAVRMPPPLVRRVAMFA